MTNYDYSMGVHLEGAEMVKLHMLNQGTAALTLWSPTVETERLRSPPQA